jgi:hypothetical protein
MREQWDCDDDDADADVPVSCCFLFVACSGKRRVLASAAAGEHVSQQHVLMLSAIHSQSPSLTTSSSLPLLSCDYNHDKTVHMHETSVIHEQLFCPSHVRSLSLAPI